MFTLLLGISLEIYFPIINKILGLIRTEIKTFFNNNLTFAMENIIIRVIPFLGSPIILSSFWPPSRGQVFILLVSFMKLCYNRPNYAKNYIWKYCKKRLLLFKQKQYIFFKKKIGIENYGKDFYFSFLQKNLRSVQSGWTREWPEPEVEANIGPEPDPSIHPTHPRPFGSGWVGWVGWVGQIFAQP